MVLPSKTFLGDRPVLKYLSLAMLLMGLLGCSGSNGPTLYPVSGAVTFQGEAVEKGQVSFVPDTTEIGGGPAQYLSIENGKYAGKVSAGLKKVGISASRPTGKFQVDEDGNSVPVIDSFIPDRYNEQTTLSVEIKPAVNEGLDFHLK